MAGDSLRRHSDDPNPPSSRRQPRQIAEHCREHDPELLLIDATDCSRAARPVPGSLSLRKHYGPEQIGPSREGARLAKGPEVVVDSSGKLGRTGRSSPIDVVAFGGNQGRPSSMSEVRGWSSRATENRNTLALQLKLDELILATRHARNHL